MTKRYAKELLARRQATDNLYDLTRYMHERGGQRAYIDSEPHREIAAACEAWSESKEDSTLIITLPPQVGKSEIVSRTLPIRILAKNPHASILSLSYSLNLSADFGREVRNQINEQQVFPINVAKDSHSVSRFHTNNKGLYYAAGAGGSLTGRGFTHILLDDLVKGREQAQNARRLDGLWAWLGSDVLTRFKPGPKRLLCVATRWSENDPTGMFMRHDDRGIIKHVHYPALLDEGLPTERSFCPKLRPTEDYQELREYYHKTGQAYTWRALYQGAPTADEGDFFSVDALRVVSELPDKAKSTPRYLCMDLAPSMYKVCNHCS